MKKILLFSMGFLIVSGCAPFSFPIIPKPPQTKFSQYETEKHTPRFVIIDGRTYPVVDEVERTYSVGLDQKEIPIPAWKKVWLALWGWGGILAVIIVGLMFIGVPVIPILIMAIGRIRQTNKHLTQIVSSVDKGLQVLPADQQAVFKAELSKVQDMDVKKAVQLIRAEVLK